MKKSPMVRGLTDDKIEALWEGVRERRSLAQDAARKKETAPMIGKCFREAREVDLNIGKEGKKTRYWAYALIVGMNEYGWPSVARFENRPTWDGGRLACFEFERSDMLMSDGNRSDDWEVIPRKAYDEAVSEAVATAQKTALFGAFRDRP
jgi:hypothetical protein